METCKELGITVGQQEEKRTRGMSMLAAGVPRDEIVNELGVNLRTVRNWGNRSAADRLNRSTHHGRDRLTEQESNQITELVATSSPRNLLGLKEPFPTWTTARVQQLIVKHYPECVEALVSKQTLRKWLKARGFNTRGSDGGVRQKGM
jgi:transposase